MQETKAMQMKELLQEALEYVDTAQSEAYDAYEQAGSARSSADSAADEARTAYEYADSAEDAAERARDAASEATDKLNELMDLLTDDGNAGEKSLEADILRYKNKVRELKARGFPTAKIAETLQISEFLVQACLELEAA